MDSRTLEKTLIDSANALRVYKSEAKHVLAGKGCVIRNDIAEKFLGCCAGIDEAPLSQAQKIMECFMLGGISHIGEECLTDLFRFCVEAVANPEVLDKTVFTVGIGASESLISARLPAYIIPPLQIMRALHGAGLPVPKLRILSGARLGLCLNEFSEEKVLANMEMSFRILYMFAKRFFPDVVDRIFFDRDLYPGRILDRLERFRQNWLESLEKYPDEYRILTTLAGCGQKNGCRTKIEGSAKYVIMHSFVFGDIAIRDIPATEWESENNHSDSIFISFGGRPERLFNFFRAYFSANLEDAERRRSIRLIVRVGEKPVYYPIDGEPLFGQLRPDWLGDARKNPFFKKNRIHFDFNVFPKEYEQWAMDVEV